MLPKKTYGCRKRDMKILGRVQFDSALSSDGGEELLFNTKAASRAILTLRSLMSASFENG